MSILRSSEGEMVDEICRAHYGGEDLVEAVYATNPGLADLGPVLPKGVLITLPPKTPAVTARPIRLWSAPNDT